MLQIFLLGGFRLVYNGEVVTTVSQPRQQALLTYLLLYRHAPQSRQQIAFHLQPDAPEAQSRANLRRELYHLRRALPQADQLLQIDASMLWWRPTVPVYLDFAEFEWLMEEAHAKQKKGDASAVRTILQDALKIYKGPLLPACYDEWLAPPRQEFEDRLVQGLILLIEILETQRVYAQAILYAERLLRHDPLQEATYRRLMRLHALHSDRARALRIYHDCCAILEQELAVEPSAETRMLYEQLLQTGTGAPIRPTSEETHVDKGVLVGRQAEWELLLSAWRKAKVFGAHCVMIAGEAGIGKSRLVEELRRWAARLGIPASYARSYAAQGALAYAPVGDLLRGAALANSWRDLEDVWLTELARLLPEILVERPDVPRPAAMSERWQRLRFFEALARAVLALDEPTLLLFDDLQWYAPETLEWLSFLLQFSAHTPLLLVGTVRPEGVAGDHPYHSLVLALKHEGQLTEIELGPLSAAETALLATQTLGRNLDDDVKERLYAYSEGNPLFVVEIARAGLLGIAGAEDEPQTSHANNTHVSASLPPKVYAVIKSRLVQLSEPAQRLVRLAATVGRSFTVPILAATGELPEDNLFQGLDELWQRRIIRSQGVNEYDFHHDRIRDVAYAEIGPVHRPRLHSRVAQALEEIHGHAPDEAAAQLAVHYEKAGLVEKSIANYRQAARTAEQVYAHGEAVRYLSQALALLSALSPTPARRRQELDMVLALGSQLVAIRGWTHREVGDVYRRALALCEETGEPVHRFVALRGLHTYYQVKADFIAAHQVANELLVVAQSDRAPGLFAYAYFHLGTLHLQIGQFVQARQDFEQSVESFAPLRVDPQMAVFRPDNRVFADCFLSHTLWILGYPEQALTHSRQAMTHAKELANPFDQMVAMVYGATLHQLRGEVRAAQKLLATAEKLGGEYDIAYYRDWAIILRGWVRTELPSADGEQTDGEQTEAGIALIRQGLDQFERLGAGVRRPYYLGLLAVALRKQGDYTAALETLEQAQVCVERSGERWYAADLFRLRGELLLESTVTRNEAQAEGEALFRQALEIARDQQTRAFELRAATSLARLWQQQDRTTDAYALLAPLYDWFSEGFDTFDLTQAAALLQELA